ncbi:MAG: tyrosine-protein phosphatase [Campylobacterota bacterium]|nr:tyrosine-protein phosphatase [Campylobacterota bacterium]
MIKKILKALGVLLVIFGVVYVWHVHFNYRFETISEGKVYKSALIDPDKLEGYLKDNKIKTIVDLLDPGVQDDLNPAKHREIDAEDKAVNEFNKKYNANVKHVNIPSGQTPTKKTLTKFFEILDDKENYPILIHCYHGTGRAQIYSALYRIEYENWTNSDARDKTRVVVQALGYKSSFSDKKSKGKFLMGYKPRSEGENSTFETLK